MILTLIEINTVLIQFILSIFKSFIKLIPIFVTYKDIKDDVILITGGGRGLGKHLAIQYAKHNPKKVYNNEDIYKYLY